MHNQVINPITFRPGSHHTAVTIRIKFSEFNNELVWMNLQEIVSTFQKENWKLQNNNCVKSVPIQNFSGLYFPLFGLANLQLRTHFTQWMMLWICTSFELIISLWLNPLLPMFSLYIPWNNSKAFSRV